MEDADDRTSPTDDPEFRRRARERASWPARRFRLGEEPPENLLATRTAEECIGMVWQMTVDAWALAGREIPPPLPRDQWPIHIKRLGEPDSAAVRLPRRRADDEG